nr:DNA-3-methyladenine glycosylase I [Micromonospora sp. DSM 115978]
MRPGPDGRLRCPWPLGVADYLEYHDTEWGVPVHDSVGLFERISLEVFQSGLSWLTILRKREAFRRAFAGFDPATVAAYGPVDVERRRLHRERHVRGVEGGASNRRSELVEKLGVGGGSGQYRLERDACLPGGD